MHIPEAMARVWHPKLMKKYNVSLTNAMPKQGQSFRKIVMYSINQQTFFWKKKRLEEMNLKHYSRAELML